MDIEGVAHLVKGNDPPFAIEDGAAGQNGLHLGILLVFSPFQQHCGFFNLEDVEPVGHAAEGQHQGEPGDDWAGGVDGEGLGGGWGGSEGGLEFEEEGVGGEAVEAAGATGFVGRSGGLGAIEAGAGTIGAGDCTVRSPFGSWCNSC